MNVTASVGSSTKEGWQWTCQSCDIKVVTAKDTEATGYRPWFMGTPQGWHSASKSGQLADVCIIAAAQKWADDLDLALSL